MLGGYVGKLLRVDLTAKTMKDEVVPEHLLRKYIGGLGLAAKILYDELSPDVKPTDPENRVIFMAGPLGGTPAPGSGQCCVVSLNHETGFTLGVAHFHGVFGATLKFAGYDGVIIQGASPVPLYLWIDDGKAELRDASHLWGKDTHETYELLRQEVGQPLATVACIGPAGENMVSGAAVCTDLHHMAAKGGMGVILGSKKLKAIVCCGTGGVPISDPDSFLEAILRWRKDIWAPGTVTETLGMGGAPRRCYKVYADVGLLAFKNLLDPDGGADMGRRIVEAANKSKVRPQASFACPVACAYRFEVGVGPYTGFVATPGGGGENIEGASGLMGVNEPGANYWLTEMNDQAGIDSAAPGVCMAVLFELYNEGIITKEQTDGLDLSWGNTDAVRQLFQKIINKEGIGKILAQGPKKTAEYFGPEAKKRMLHIKGAAINLHDWRPLWGTLFSYGVSTAGPCHQGIGTERRAEPELGYTEPQPLRTVEGKAEAVRRLMIRKHWDDSNGTCWFMSTGVPNGISHSARAVAAATGWKDLSVPEVLLMGQRALNLMKLFSLRRGHTPADDLDFGPRLLEAPTGGLAKGQTVAPHLKKLLAEYYGLQGWDPETGKPTKETLERVGLGEYWKDIADLEIPIKVQDVVLPI